MPKFDVFSPIEILPLPMLLERSVKVTSMDLYLHVGTI